MGTKLYYYYFRCVGVTDLISPLDPTEKRVLHLSHTTELFAPTFLGFLQTGHLTGNTGIFISPFCIYNVFILIIYFNSITFKVYV